MRIITNLCFVTLCLLPVAAFAHPDNVDECEKATSTSGVQACLKTQLERAQARLTDAYKALDEKFDTKEQRDELKELQQTWLRYRDQECMWEADQAAAPGLKGINELSCMVRVSNDRADLLEISHMDVDPEVMRAYANTSRWKNLLSTDYRHIIWDIDQAEKIDLNCDGEDEIVAQGVKYSETDMCEIASQPLFGKREIIAIIKNPDIGSVSAEIFEFDVFDEVNDNAAQNLICDSKVKLSYKVNEVLTEDESEVKSCESIITMNLNGCYDRKIVLEDKEFKLIDREIIKEEKE
ncbi:MAG: lysozyme inhibitor LprI family protein [Pseudomonadota bacterium]